MQWWRMLMPNGDIINHQTTQTQERSGHKVCTSGSQNIIQSRRSIHQRKQKTFINFVFQPKLKTIRQHPYLLSSKTLSRIGKWKHPSKPTLLTGAPSTIPILPSLSMALRPLRANTCWKWAPIMRSSHPTNTILPKNRTFQVVIRHSNGWCRLLRGRYWMFIVGRQLLVSNGDIGVSWKMIT